MINSLIIILDLETYIQVYLFFHIVFVRGVTSLYATLYCRKYLLLLEDRLGTPSGSECVSDSIIR